MKRFLCVLLICLFLTMPCLVYANSENSFSFRTARVADLFEKYMEDPQFAQLYRDNPKLAMKQIYAFIDSEAYVQSLLENVPRSGDTSSAYVTPNLLMQKETYYCGPASALVALKGKGIDYLVSGSTTDNKQDTLATEMNTTGSGTGVFNLLNVLNSKVSASGSFDEYIAIQRSALSSANQLWPYLHGSMMEDYMPILHAQTQYFEYYSGHQSGHYIAAYYCQNTQNTYVGLVDTNRNISYYGLHLVSIGEVWDALHREDPDTHQITYRYLITAIPQDWY